MADWVVSVPADDETSANKSRAPGRPPVRDEAAPVAAMLPGLANKGSVAEAPLRWVDAAGGREVQNPAFSSHEKVVEFWKSKGAPEHVAQAWADRVGRESGFRADLVAPDKGGPSGGLYQAHQERLADLQKLPNWQDPTVQHDWAYGQVTGGDPIATAHYKEINEAPTREAASRLLDKYFFRSAGSDGDPWARHITAAGGRRVGDQWIAQEQGRKNAAVRYADIDDLLALASDTDDKSRKRWLRDNQALLKEAGAEGPVFDVKREGNKARIIDDNARPLLEDFKAAGITQVPVSFRGAGDMSGVEAVVAPSGRQVPLYDFKPVPAVSRETQPFSRFDPTGESGRFWSGVRSAAEGAAQFIGNTIPPMTEHGAQVRARMDQEVADRIRGLEAAGQTKWPYQAGEIAAMLPAAAAAGPIGGTGFLARVAGGAVGGGIAGAAQPVEDPARFWSEKVEQIGLGALGGAVAVPVAETVMKGLGGVASPVARWLGILGSPEAIGSPGAKAVLQRLDQDVRGGGPTAQDMMDIVASAPAKPLTLMDVGGENVLGLAGRVARQPGPARQQMKQFLDERDAAAGSRIAEDVRGGISRGGTAYATKEALMRARSAAARPLYEKAFSGGSMAPLEVQFENAFREVGQAEAAAAQRVSQVRQAATQAAAKQSTAGNVYSASAANREARYAADRIADAERNLQSARAQKDAIRERLRGAQADRTANAPGAVWSPRLQEFLDDPTVKQGIRRGWKLQRLEDLADGVPFNPHEFAIVGTAANGDPIVGKVPNMRLLDAGKKGLDAIVTRHTDPLTGRMDETGKVVNDVRIAYRAELDRLNADYKAARDAWAGPSQAIDAVNAGRRVLATNPEKIAADLAQMTPGDREFYKLGARDILVERLAKKGPTADEAKLIIGNDWTKSQLRPLFSNQADYDRFIAAVEAEARMFKTGYDVLGNSRTAARMAEDFSPMADTMAHAGHAALNVAHNHWVGAVANALRATAAFRRRADPLLNADIAGILTGPLAQGSPGMRLLQDFAGQMPKTRNYLSQSAPVAGQIAAPVVGNRLSQMAR